jgi:hypothetical protein
MTLSRLVDSKKRLLVENGLRFGFVETLMLFANVLGCHTKLTCLIETSQRDEDFISHDSVRCM